ncbi:MAG: NusG domain II-containing protein [Clostridiales bacterium]|nr:NusG domain II-containing protein [Clostridiales bacterium]
MLLIIAIVSVGLLVYNNLRQSENVTAQILVNNAVVTTVELSTYTQFSLPGHEQIVFNINNDGIAFAASDCPDKVCVHTGYISHAGQTAVCLPNRVAIRIVERIFDPDAPDAVAN